MRRLLLLALLLTCAAPSFAGWSFDSTTPDTLISSTVPTGLGDNVFTVHAQVRDTDGTVAGTVWAICDASADRYHRILSHSNERFYVYSLAGGTSGAIGTAATFTTDVWYTGQGVFSATNSRSAYLNGTNKVTETTNVVPTGLDSIVIGDTVAPPSASVPFTGEVGLIAAWTDALSDGEIASLGKGAWPPYVSSATLGQLVLSYGQGASEPDVVGGGSFTVTTATKVGHKNLAPWPGMQ